jgi:hypothetical protein
MTIDEQAKLCIDEHTYNDNTKQATDYCVRCVCFVVCCCVVHWAREQLIPFGSGKQRSEADGLQLGESCFAGGTMAEGAGRSAMATAGELGESCFARGVMAVL